MDDGLTRERITAAAHVGGGHTRDLSRAEERAGELWRTKEWLLVCVVSLVTAPQGCEQPRGGPVSGGEATPVLVGVKVPGMIASRDRSCPGSFEPCRVYQVSADKAGVLRASLTWTKKTNGFRLEVWNGDNAEARCCHSGESASIAVMQADRAEIRVIAVTSKDKRQTFELMTSWERSQE